MATSVEFVCNAGMERVFFTSKDGIPIDLSRSLKFSVFFEIENCSKPNEARYLRVTIKDTPETVRLIKLKDHIGIKPRNGLVTPYKPTERPLIVTTSSEIETERVIYAEEDISDDEQVAVFLRIIPVAIGSDDIRRYLSFKQRNGRINAFVNDEDIDLDGAGGKKPLGLGFAKVNLSIIHLSPKEIITN